jgi:hypothetical protein
MEPFIQCNPRSTLSVMDSMLVVKRLVFQLGKIPVSVSQIAMTCPPRTNRVVKLFAYIVYVREICIWSSLRCILSVRERRALIGTRSRHMFICIEYFTVMNMFHTVV